MAEIGVIVVICHVPVVFDVEDDKSDERMLEILHEVLAIAATGLATIQTASAAMIASRKLRRLRMCTSSCGVRPSWLLGRFLRSRLRAVPAFRLVRCHLSAASVATISAATAGVPLLTRVRVAHRIARHNHPGGLPGQGY